MRRLFLFAFTLISIYSYSQDSLQIIVSGRKNSPEQQKKPYVILISVDGLGAEMAKKFKPSNISRLSKNGVKADYMLSSFPSLTFPNHYTIATGLYPAHHGLVNNNFYDEQRSEWYSMNNKGKVRDGSWYGGTPIWVLAEQNQMISASFFWVASESNVKGIRPTYYYNYTEKISMRDRINTVKKWLQLPSDRRPHLITFYLPQVDHEAHLHGPESKEARDAVNYIDRSIGQLVSVVDSLHLAVNYILVSDHGMAKLNPDRVIRSQPVMDSSRFKYSSSSALIQVYVKDKKKIPHLFRQFKTGATGYKVYLTESTPLHWHFNKKDDPFKRVGDILLVADPPAYFYSGKGEYKNKGTHGFDPALKTMHASFYAWGPAFKKMGIGSFENVHVFPLITQILGLDYNFQIDGRKEALSSILR